MDLSPVSSAYDREWNVDAGTRSLGAAGDRDLGWAHDARADSVARANNRRHRVILVLAGGVGHDRLVLVRREWRPLRLDALEPGALDLSAQVALDQQDPLDPAGLTRVVGNRLNCTLEVVQYWQQAHDSVDTGSLAYLVALLLDAPTEVLEIGLGALGKAQIFVRPRSVGGRILARGWRLDVRGWLGLGRLGHLTMFFVHNLHDRNASQTGQATPV